MVANDARKVMWAPGLPQRCYHISDGNLVTHKAQVSKELVVMCLAVGESPLLIMATSKEGLLTPTAHKVLDVPVLTQRGDHTLLNRPPTRSTDRNSHPVMALEAVQLVHVVHCVSGAVLYFACRRVQLDAATLAVEVISMVDFTSEAKWCIFVDDAMALVTNILSIRL